MEVGQINQQAKNQIDDCLVKHTNIGQNKLINFYNQFQQEFNLQIDCQKLQEIYDKAQDQYLQIQIKSTKLYYLFQNPVVLPIFQGMFTIDSHVQDIQKVDQFEIIFSLKENLKVLQQNFKSSHKDLIDYPVQESYNFDFEELYQMIENGSNVLQSLQQQNSTKIQELLINTKNIQLECKIQDSNQYLKKQLTEIQSQVEQNLQFNKITSIILNKIIIKDVQNFHQLIDNFCVSLEEFQTQQNIYQMWRQNQIPKEYLLQSIKTKYQESFSNIERLTHISQLIQYQDYIQFLETFSGDFLKFSTFFQKLNQSIDKVYELIIDSILNIKDQIRIKQADIIYKNPQIVIENKLQQLKLRKEMRFINEIINDNQQPTQNYYSQMIFDKLVYKLTSFQFLLGTSCSTYFSYDTKHNDGLSQLLQFSQDFNILIYHEDKMIQQQNLIHSQAQNKSHMLKTDNMNQFCSVINKTIQQYNSNVLSINQMKKEDIFSQLLQQQRNLLNINQFIRGRLNNYKYTDFGLFKSFAQDYQQIQFHQNITTIEKSIQTFKIFFNTNFISSFNQINGIAQNYVKKFNLLKINPTCIFYQNFKINYDHLNNMIKYQSLKIINCLNNENQVRITKNMNLQDMHDNSNNDISISKLQVSDILFQLQNFTRIIKNNIYPVQIQVTEDCRRLAIYQLYNVPQQLKISDITRLIFSDNVVQIFIEGKVLRFKGNIAEQWYLSMKNLLQELEYMK